MIYRTLASILISCLAVGMSPYSANAAIKPGSSCAKENQVRTESGKKYTCIKKNKKLVWNNGVKSGNSDQGITVDKNIFTVDVTLPASFYEGENITQAKLNADAAKKGYGKATLNKDGSVTLRMSKAEHSKAVAEMKKSVDDYIRETVNDSPKVFREITYNKNMTEFNISVDKAKFEEDLASGMIGFGIGMLSAYFQWFNGIENPKTAIKLIDANTGKVFDTQAWPPKD
jgi:hypothetical protein